MVLVSLLKAIRKHAPTDKVVLVSNYTEVGAQPGYLDRITAALCPCWGGMKHT